MTTRDKSLAALERQAAQMLLQQEIADGMAKKYVQDWFRQCAEAAQKYIDNPAGYDKYVRDPENGLMLSLTEVRVLEAVWGFGDMAHIRDRLKNHLQMWRPLADGHFPWMVQVCSVRGAASKNGRSLAFILSYLR